MDGECVRKCVEVVAAVIRQGDKVLATQRGYGEFKDGWEFPGGKMEANPVLKEHKAAKWLTKDELDSIEWLPADQSLLDGLKKLL